jgi:hypothetical protein
MQYLFDLGKALGKSDAAAVANSVTPPLTPIEKLYVLPISMKKTGRNLIENSSTFLRNFPLYKCMI